MTLTPLPAGRAPVALEGTALLQAQFAAGWNEAGSNYEPAACEALEYLRGHAARRAAQTIPYTKVNKFIGDQNLGITKKHATMRRLAEKSPDHTTVQAGDLAYIFGEDVPLRDFIDHLAQAVTVPP